MASKEELKKRIGKLVKEKRELKVKLAKEQALCATLRKANRNLTSAGMCLGKELAGAAKLNKILDEKVTAALMELAR